MVVLPAKNVKPRAKILQVTTGQSTRPEDIQKSLRNKTMTYSTSLLAVVYKVKQMMPTEQVNQVGMMALFRVTAMSPIVNMVIILI